MTKVYKVWCEWDWNQNEVVFDTKRAAELWVDKCIVDYGVEESRPELEEEGLVSIEWVDLMTIETVIG